MRAFQTYVNRLLFPPSDMDTSTIAEASPQTSVGSSAPAAASTARSAIPGASPTAEDGNEEDFWLDCELLFDDPYVTETLYAASAISIRNPLAVDAFAAPAPASAVAPNRLRPVVGNPVPLLPIPHPAPIPLFPASTSTSSTIGQSRAAAVSNNFACSSTATSLPMHFHSVRSQQVPAGGTAPTGARLLRGLPAPRRTSMAPLLLPPPQVHPATAITTANSAAAPSPGADHQTVCMLVVSGNGQIRSAPAQASTTRGPPLATGARAGTGGGEMASMITSLTVELGRHGLKPEIDHVVSGERAVQRVKALARHGLWYRMVVLEVEESLARAAVTAREIR